MRTRNLLDVCAFQSFDGSQTNGMQSLKGLVIAFCIAVGAAFAWHSYGDAAKHVIARSSQWTGWLASWAAPIAYKAPDTKGLGAQAAPSPDQQRLNAMSADLDAMRQIIDRIAVTQEQTTRNIDKLTASQERMTRNVDLRVMMPRKFRGGPLMLRRRRPARNSE